MSSTRSIFIFFLFFTTSNTSWKFIISFITRAHRQLVHANAGAKVEFSLANTLDLSAKNPWSLKNL